MSKQKLRRESSVQDSGYINLKPIPHLKEQHYYVVNVPLDGDAPKQYIKAYFYYKNCPKKKKKAKWHGFFAKSGGKSYPHESVIEFVVNKIGDYIGLNMNKTRLVIANGQIRFLSQDFIGENQRLIHGVEILAEYFEDKEFVDEINKDRKNRRQYLTFDVIERAINHVYKNEGAVILEGLIKLITFDAIVGNVDRHFYNWGVIGNVTGNEKTVFSPIYDTARALLWNKTEDAILKIHKQYIRGSHELDGYINRSKPRFSFEENPTANHFELIEYLCRYKKEYRVIIKKLITYELENYVIGQLKENVYCFFGIERCILMEAILRKRFTKLRNSAI